MFDQMIKLKLDSSKALNAQNTFVSAWLPGFTRHTPPPSVSATGGKDDRGGEERRRGGEERNRTKIPPLFIQAVAHIEKEDCNRASRGGAEGEMRKRRK